MSRKSLTRELRSNSQGCTPETGKFGRSKRKPKYKPEYIKYIAEVREEAKKITSSHWHRSEPGEIVLHSMLSSTDSNDPYPDEFIQFQERLKQCRGYKDPSEVKFDVSPTKKTPQKAITNTCRKRKFIRTQTIRMEYEDPNGKVKKKIRLAAYQEEKNPQADSTPENCDPLVKDGVKKLVTKFNLLSFFQTADKNEVSIERKITPATLGRGKKARKERQKGPLADETIAYYQKKISSQAQKEQKIIPLDAHYEFSHLIPRSQGGPNFTLPTTEGHNSMRIPIEILVPFLIKLGLYVKFKTVDQLLTDKQGQIIPVPYCETIIFNLPQISRNIKFELHPLSPIGPVNGCYDLAKEAIRFSLLGTNFYSKASVEIEKRKKRNKAKYAKESETVLNL